MGSFTPKVYMVMEHDRRDFAYVLSENGKQIEEYTLEYTAQVASEGLVRSEGTMVNFHFMSDEERKAYSALRDALATFNDLYYKK